MGVDQGGYMTDPAGEKAKLVRVVDACIAAGVYVLIDWHDHEATQHVNESVAFFSEMASTYGSLPNVLFETFNEPLDRDDLDDWSTSLKPYHEAVVPAIREHSNNIITLGTRAWSQNVDEACRDKVDGTNLAYTLHFYAQIHYQDLRDKGIAAMADGCALFVSEWGPGWGDGTLDLYETKLWIDWIDELKLPSARWGVYDKNGENPMAILTYPAGPNATSGGWAVAEPIPPIEGCCVGESGCMCGWCSSTINRCRSCGGGQDTSVPDTCSEPTEDGVRALGWATACMLAVAGQILALA